MRVREGDGELPVGDIVRVRLRDETLRLVPVWVSEVRDVAPGETLRLEWQHKVGGAVQAPAKVRWVACIDPVTPGEVVAAFAEFAREHGYAPALDHPLWRDLWAAAE